MKNSLSQAGFELASRVKSLVNSELVKRRSRSPKTLGIPLETMNVKFSARRINVFMSENDSGIRFTMS